jgi:hypothetical protein
MEETVRVQPRLLRPPKGVHHGFTKHEPRGTIEDKK